MTSEQGTASKISGGPLNTAFNALGAAAGDAPERDQAAGEPITASANYASINQTEGDTMKALAWFGKNDVRIVDAQRPHVIDRRDVVIKVTGSTCCGSDLHLLHNAITAMERGDILGHEGMGVVDELGPDVKGLKKGDRVVASFNIGCGECWSCKKGWSSACITTNKSQLQNAMYGNRSCGMFGYSHLTGGFAGCQAEYIRIPNGDANLLKLPDEVPDEAGLFLSDILVTSYHQVVDSGVTKGDIVGIWGAGAIGLFSAKWSFLKGASRVIMIDNVQQRLDYAKSKMPEIELLNYGDAATKDVVKTLNEWTSNERTGNQGRPAGLDKALECAAGEYAKSFVHKVALATGLETDTPEIINECIQAVRPFGTVGVTGVYASFTMGFNIGAVMEKGVRFIGNGQAPVHLYWKEILNDYLIPKKVDVVDLIVTHRVALEDLPAVYKAMDDKTHGMIKTFITTKFSNPPSAGAPQLTKM